MTNEFIYTTIYIKIRSRAYRSYLTPFFTYRSHALVNVEFYQKKDGRLDKWKSVGRIKSPGYENFLVANTTSKLEMLGDNRKAAFYRACVTASISLSHQIRLTLKKTGSKL